LCVDSNLAVFDAVLVCLGSSYMVFSLPLVVILVYLIGTFYLKTSRTLREIDLEARTPLYSHLSETVDGIETIRAFHWEDKFQVLALDKLETSQKPMYMMMIIQRWLNIVLDLITAGMGLLVISLAFSIPSSTDPGFLGVSLTAILTFTSVLRQVVTQWTMMETQFASVTRTKKFVEDTFNENDQDTTADPAVFWPAGNIHASNMTIEFE
jgi:ATP-binding cassette, subfamily C (CFTR/MRP), member 1